MEISIGSKVVFKKDGNEYSGIVTYYDDNEYVVCFSSDGKLIEFETILLKS